MLQRAAGLLIGTAACLVIFAPAASAEQVVAVGAGLGNTNPTVRIVEFNGNVVVQAPLSITGFANPATEHISGVDYRPANGRLYAVTVDTGQLARLYTLEPATGVLTRVDAAQTYALGAGAIEVGVDFDPTLDRLRIVSNADDNLRVDPDTAVATPQTPLAYELTDVNTGRNPQITAIAYDNNRAGATGTSLLDIDTDVVSVGRSTLVAQIPAANGALRTVRDGFVVNGDVPVGADFSPLGPLYSALTNPSPGGPTTIFRSPDPLTITGFTSITLAGSEDVTNISVVPVPSQLSVEDVTVREGDTATVAVSRSASGDGSGLTVDFATVPGSAGASDFSATSGTLTFALGENRKTFTMATTEDEAEEGDESLSVALSNPSRTAAIADGSGTITIADDDRALPPDPQPPDPPPADRVAPNLTIDFDPAQALRGNLSLKASCSEPCSVVADAKVKTDIPRDGERVLAGYTVLQDGTKLNSAQETASLELVLTKKALKKARNALDQGGTAKVKGVVTATDESINVAKQRFKIELE